MSLSVMIDSGRRWQRRQVVKILSRVLVTLHVARGGGQELFGRLAMIWETRDAHTDTHSDLFALSDRELVL